MRYGLIDKERNSLSVKRLCEILHVAESGYYAWKKRGESLRFKENEAILADIRRVHAEHNGRYGSKRIHKQLKTELRGCSRARIERLMRRHEICAKSHKRFKVKTTDSNHDFPIAPNLLGQKFTAKHANHVWLADITYIPTNEGWIYLATVLDLYSRKVVGFALADHMKTSLPQEALRMALKHQKPTGEIIHHSDRGSQYASKDYQKDLKTANITPSMSRKGNCYDNAPQESFFKTLKTELVYHTIYKTKQEAKIDLFKYIEIYYNAKRIHSSINYLTPNQMFNKAA